MEGPRVALVRSLPVRLHSARLLHLPRPQALAHSLLLRLARLVCDLRANHALLSVFFGDCVEQATCVRWFCVVYLSMNWLEFYHLLCKGSQMCHRVKL